MATAVDERQVNGTRPPFTEEQERAIHTRDVSVALSAGAGCGKTFVLTERFLSHLEPEENGAPSYDLSELVAITFTERAAREMRDRIRAKCLERLRHAPQQHGDYWLRLLRSLDSARVSTIHSFCGTLLRSHPVEAELDPAFAVLEPAQAETLLAELIDDLLRTKLPARDADVLELVVVFGLTRLREAIADLYERARGHDFAAWLDKTPVDLTECWREYHHTRSLPQLVDEFSQSRAAVEVVRILREQDFDDGKMRERRTSLLDLLPRIATSKTIGADLERIHENARVTGTKKCWPDDDVYERFKSAAEALRKQTERLSQFVQFDAAKALASARSGLALLRLAADVERAYDATKSELAVLDFDDLLLRARRLLTDPKHKDLQKRLVNDTRLLLVDEFQDTDPIQVGLIKALCGEHFQAGKLFFVGDFKQSIYRFRGADPRVFRQLEHDTPDAGRLPLNRNFRSQPAILAFINALFCEAFCGPDAANMRYEPLVPNRSQTHAGPAIEFMWCLGDQAENTDQAGAKDAPCNSDREPQSVESLRRREADWIARRICQLLAGNQPEGPRPLEIYDRMADRPRGVRKGDIAILFRSLSDVACYEEALRSYGIDYYLVGGHAFYAQQEIYDVLNLLRSLTSPADEVALAGVLRSPFFSLADETLFWLSQHEQGLWARLCAQPPPEALDESQRERVSFAAGVLCDLRAAKDRVPIAALLDLALNRTGYDAALLGEFLGERKLANLRKLIGQARTIDHAGVMGLSNFIVQLSQFVFRQPREPLAATHPEATDVVRLMTIHQAKGLEFPVVFVPDLARHVRDSSDTADYSDELGPLVKLPKEHDDGDALDGRRLHAIADAAEDKDELIRLLYVATTRAADFLVLSAAAKSLERANGPWMELLAERFDLLTGRLIARVPEGYATPKVRVLTEAPQVPVRPDAHRSRVDLKQLVAEIDEAANDANIADVLPADPIACDGAVRRRFSVSRLQATFNDRPALIARDTATEALSAGDRDAITLGKLVHAVLANLDLRQTNDLASRVLIHGEKLSVRDAAILDEALRLVEKFIDSQRVAELRRARQIHREVEFLLAWPPDEPDPNGRYLQGYLDCLYQDADGGWHVLDYKTNQAAPADLSRLVEVYEMQMLVYGLAAEQALGEPVKGLVLHFLRTGVEHIFECNGDARRRAIELVHCAMEAQCRNPIVAAAPGASAGTLL